ncbi:DUF4279 domain-containing protein [Zoogloea sp.]|jgi:hypothetical protein|uniref:DUF4279 domain-containing protein n=1 Tax=Zoogloea sp. TaxID=49181 RepID=UPI0037DA74C8
MKQRAISESTANTTQLVFCSEDVNPDDVTRLLDLTPTQSVKVSDSAEYENGHRYISHLGIWKLELLNANVDHTIEEQIDQWIDLLSPRSEALSHLKGLGYRPYLDCKAASGSLSLCIEPELLVRLGELNISLSVWLYE